MVNPQVSLMDLTVEAGIPGDVMRALRDDKNIVSVPFMTDCVWLWLMKVLKKFKYNM